ncbi:hypothetical protein [Chamaesiphon sp.]|uniref:hypothetical protein n=1 Tax=Chamaesiphon sp. TaxID=2814140 RepID=UPI003593A0A7
MALRLLLAHLLLWSLDLPRSVCEDRDRQIVNRPENLTQSDFIIVMSQYFSQNE